MQRVRAIRSALLTGFVLVGLVSPAVPAAPVGAAGPGQVDITLLNLNDFHGRIDANTLKVVGTVEAQRAAAGEANTLLLSAGDNIGASLFASAVLQDQPTIDVLNVMDLAASAVGNHEFDQGWTDLRDRVIDGGTNATWDYLGANVYDTATMTPVLPEYSVFTVAGETVGVIGVVTAETPSLVSPSATAGLTFGDPVDAVNRVAAQLSDGNEANGEASIIVAEYHDGAAFGSPESTFDDQVAAGGPFADIVNNTSAFVDVIFTGHTHKVYVWDAPIPGSPGATRPIVQTGSYGERLGKVVLTVDQATHSVVAYAGSNISRSTATDSDLVAAYPRVADAKPIVDAALANAATVGNQVVGTVGTDITTAFNNGSYVGGVYTAARINANRDNRALESTLGALVSDSMLSVLSDPARGGAEIAVMNPGGLRAELYYPGATVADDGKITYAEANSVLPFVNNLFTITVTGAQFKTLLEQQWQRDAAGAVPSRPYLQLGLSSNVTYTFDASLPEGSRITSITVNGAPIDPAAEYRVGSNSFLLEGGDNFHVFKQGTDRADSGFIDRDAWIAYLQAHPNLQPDFARQSVSVSPLPTTVVRGSNLATTVSSLNLTSLGSPENTSLAVTLGGVSLGSVAISNGSASVDLVVPSNVPAGVQELEMVATPSNTTVSLWMTVEAAAPTAAPDEYTVDEDSTTEFDVLANDNDDDTDPMVIASSTAAAHGTATCTAVACTYTPAANYFGDDSFTYTLDDGTSTSTATVTVHVTSVNDPPVVSTLNVDVVVSTALTFELLSSPTDADGDTLTITSYTQPSHGSVTCTPTGTCTYTPTPGYVGPDSFTFVVSDGVAEVTASLAATQQGTVTIVVAAPATTTTIRRGLPSTGADTGSLLAPAIFVLLGGAFLIVVTRRRRVPRA